MNETRNLCAQIPIALHDRIHENDNVIIGLNQNEPFNRGNVLI